MYADRWTRQNLRGTVTEVYVIEAMVAISMYRGNLHRVPDVPRRWLMPYRTISKKEFMYLLRHRSLALSRNVLPPHGTLALPRRPI
ncbi:hypothetical protein SAY86_016013 [Trapa natans]|uniref:Uncharacterized protein n=1 Tax=Trapa natans TaxID=22666 RepID=A0AAN7LJJ4_TRANT|nr:hypothetical protein SAY86_016013 [Trapa natans]